MVCGRCLGKGNTKCRRNCLFGCWFCTNGPGPFYDEGGSTGNLIRSISPGGSGKAELMRVLRAPTSGGRGAALIDKVLHTVLAPVILHKSQGARPLVKCCSDRVTSANKMEGATPTITSLFILLVLQPSGTYAGACVYVRTIMQGQWPSGLFLIGGQPHRHVLAACVADKSTVQA